jgi:hypothetical protein
MWNLSLIRRLGRRLIRCGDATREGGEAQRSQAVQLERTEIFVKIAIPAGLPSPECNAAVNMLMTFPVLRTATLAQLSHQWVGQYYGFEILIRRCDDAENEVGDLTNPVHDREVISCFLAREEPLAR